MPERQPFWFFLLPLALAVVFLLPFLNKAYTIDDTLFLLQAQHAIEDPLHPTAFNVVWSDNRVVRCSAIMPSGPVQAFLLIPAILMNGSEVVAHSAQLVALLLGIIGTMLLARELGQSRAAAALAGSVVATSPCVLGMAGTAMPDVPSMALGVWALLFAHRWRQQPKLRWILLTVVLLALAALARPHAIFFVAIVFIMLAKDAGEGAFFRRFSWRLVDTLPLLVAVGLVFLYGRISADPGVPGGNVVGAARTLAGLVEPDRHFIAFLAHWALTTPFAFLVILLARGRVRWVFVATLAIPFGAIIAGLGFYKQTWVGLFCALSLTSLVYVLTNPRTKERPIHYALMFTMIMPLSLVIYVHLPAKYLAPSMPAAGLLLGAELDAQLASPDGVPRWLRTAIALCLLFFGVSGVLVLSGDARYGQLSRRAAKELVADAVADGKTVWFTGHWGFQWYASRAGGRVLSLDSTPSPHDLLVGPSKNHDGAYLQDRFQQKVLVDRLYDNESMVHAIHHAIEGKGLGAGFFSNWWGLLPFVIGRAEMEVWSRWEFIYLDSDP